MKLSLITGWLILLFYFSIVPDAYPQTPKPDRGSVRRLLRRGDKAFQRENYQRALESYDKVLAINPSQSTALYRSAINLLQVSNAKRAILQLEKYGRENKKVDKHYSYWLGRAYHLDMQFDKAAQSYEKHAGELPRNDSRQEELRLLKKQTDYGKAYMEGQNLDYYAVSLGAPLNSMYSDHSPIFSKDRQTLIFTSRRTENKHGEEITPRGDAFENIYTSRLTNGKWEKPVLADRSLHNRRQHTSNVQLFEEDNKMLIYKSVAFGSLFVTEREEKGWSKPKRYNKYMDTDQFEPTGFVTADGKSVYFSSGRESRDGNLDLFVSRKNPDGSWAAPERLSDEINTPADEEAPYLTPDGLTLYFCSRGHTSMGGYDIFKTTFNPVSGKWAKAENLGYPINSPADDIYFIPDSTHTSYYLTSNRQGSIGQEDLFVVKLHEPVLVKGQITNKKTGAALPGYTASFVAQRKPERQATVQNGPDGAYQVRLMSNYAYDVELTNEAGEKIHTEVLAVPPAYMAHTELLHNYQIDIPEILVASPGQRITIENLNLVKINYSPADTLTISGHVSSHGSTPAGVQVSIRKEDSKYPLLETKTNDQGFYTFRFVPGQPADYIVELTKSGYFPNSIALLYNEEVDEQKQGNHLEVNTTLSSLKSLASTSPEQKPATRQVLGGVYFEFNSAELFPESLIALDKLADFINNHPEISLEIGGYTDDLGSAQLNKQMSEKRAQAVMNYLLGKGIPGHRLVAKGYADAQPILSNQAAINGRDVNRRIEIRVINK